MSDTLEAHFAAPLGANELAGRVLQWLHVAAVATVAAAYAALAATALTFGTLETSWAQSSVPLSSMRTSSDAYAAFMDREWQLRRYAAAPSQRTRVPNRAAHADECVSAGRQEKLRRWVRRAG